MRIKLLPIILTMFLLAMSCYASTGQAAYKSIVPITDSLDQSFCTAFSVSQKQRLYMTAAHCVEDTVDSEVPYMWHQRIRVVKIDTGIDLALVQAAIGIPALTLADQPPTPGSASTITGYIGHHELQTTFTGVFYSDAVGLDKKGILRVFSLYVMRIEGGQSG